MTPLVLSMPGYEQPAERLTEELGAERGELAVRSFPDGESHVRLVTPVRDREVIVVCGLERPDPKVLPLLFALETARELGAVRVGLVAPYLCYMRQDRAFQEGEAVAARLFAQVLSRSLDWLVTVDPHLHRIHDLAEIYTVPALVVHAAPALAAWIQQHVQRPLLVGPDIESEQWVSAVAARAGAPWISLRKTRRGDRDVEVSVPDVERWRDHVPVLVDDIVSTGRTLLETIGHLGRAGMRAPVCAVVHGLFAEGADQALAAAGATVVTCNSVAHPTNRIDLVPALAEAVRGRCADTLR
jgi:ribose-phosphate pyrophosphokinase